MAAPKVLIVEDDSTLATALASTVKKAGYDSVICMQPDDALKALDRDSFKVVFIDCLLPQQPGLDLAKAIRKTFDAKILPIVLMSGVFTDRQMMKDSMQEVSALDFLKKPFEVNEVLRFLEKESVATNDESLSRSIFSLPDRVGANPARMSEFLEGVNRAHGFELPIVFSVLVTNAYSGIVHLMGEKGEKTKVSLVRGAIAQVESSDVQSYLGKLMVAGGWVVPEDLEHLLSQNSEKKLGQRLIEENFISPHALLEVMEEQMALRLSKLIQDQNYVIHFEARLTENDSPAIEPSEFYKNLDEWICSRVSDAWMNQRMINWQGYTVRLGPDHDRQGREYKAQSLSAVPDVASSIENIGVLSSLLQAHQNHIEQFNKAFYFMLCFRFVIFAERVTQMSDDERLARLQKIWLQMEKLSLIDAFSMMGGRKDMGPEEIRTVYSEFVQRHLGASPGPNSNPNLKTLFSLVKEKITQVLELFMDPQRLVAYERELEGGKVAQIGEAQLKAEEAKKYLLMRQYTSAIISLNTAAKLHPNLDYLVLMQAWAKIGLLATSKNKSKDIPEINTILSRVPNEEKISALGNLVQGLFAKSKNDIINARKSFEAALALDKNLIEARRELNSLPEVKKQVDFLHGDLGQVIGNLFKKS